MKIIKDWNKMRYKIIGKIDLFFMNVKYGFLKTFLIFVFIVNQILFLFDFIKFFDNKHIFESTILNIYINLLIGTIIIAIIGYIIRYQYYSYIIQIKNYSQNQKLELKINIKLSEEYISSGYEVKTFKNGDLCKDNSLDEYYVASRKINSKLQNETCLINIRHDAPFIIDNELITLVPKIMYWNFKAHYFMNNGKLLKQNKSLLLNADNELKYCGDSSLMMPVSKVGYYSGQCTHEIVYKKFYSLRKIGKIFDGKKLLVDDENVLYPLEYSRCANFLGASTLLITQDNKILIARQDTYSKANPNRYAPTGSGSVEWKKDYTNINTENLCDVIIHAMDRELREEWNLPGRKRLKINTKLIGYARLIERGGKPDYFGLSYTPNSFAEIKCMLKGKGFISKKEKGLQSDNYYLLSFNDDKQIIEELKRFCDDEKDQLSIQVHIILEIMEQMKQDEVFYNFLNNLRSDNC